MADLREQLQSTLGDSLILEDELGGGGMSRVFVAHEAALGRKVVVKVLPSEMAAAVSIDRFRREIQLAAQLQHPHIVPLLAAGQTDGLPYYTMPYVRGESLRARLSKGGELPLSETVRILREVASALAYAHSAGIVHRDIKPDNILISGGSAVVTDFGVAKALTASSGSHAGSLTSLGVALGTPAYMAPEQATADPNIDSRADIYSLGVVAYEMLTGATPFSGRSPQATLAAHVTEAPEAITRRRPTVPPLLAALVMKCLEKHAADRPQTAGAVMHELDALSTPSGGLTPTAALPAAQKKSSVVRMGGLGLAALTVIALAVFGAERVRRSNAERDRAITPAIAVLPLESVGRSQGQEFADGMTEEITNRLSSLRGLRVIGRQSAKAYAGSTKTPQQIASELGVKYLLTGTVRWDKSSDGKDVVRVSPALLNTEDGTQLWAEAYQTVLSGMFEVQAKVATEVANALNVTLVAPERAALEIRPTENLEAYSMYLRAKKLIDESVTVPSMRDGIALLEKAVAADPGFAQAWAYLAIGHAELFWFGGDRSQDRVRKAESALARAAALAENTADYHFARGIVLYHMKRDYEAALREFGVAQTARPSDAMVPAFIGAINRRKGNWEVAINHFKRAAQLDPRNPATMGDVAETLAVLHRWDEAEKMVDQVLILGPQEPGGYERKAAIAVNARGNIPEAVEHLRDGVRMVQPQSNVTRLLLENVWPAIEDPELRRIMIESHRTPDMIPGVFYAQKNEIFWRLGDSARARAYGDSAIAGLKSVAARSPDPSLYYELLALVYATLGRRSDAIRAMNTAEASLPMERDVYLGNFRANRWVPLYVALGDHRQAMTLITRRVGIPAGISANRLRLDPAYASLRANPEFQRVIQQ